MVKKYYNSGSVEQFSNSARAISAITRYQKKKRKKFGEMCGHVGDINSYKPELCNQLISDNVINDRAVSYEAVKYKDLKQLSCADKIYFVGDITCEVIGELDSVIASVILLYDLMLGYANTKGRNLNCLGLYPDKDNISGWFNTLSRIDSCRDCYPFIEMNTEVFTSSSSDYCIELLDSGNKFMNCLDLYFNKVSRNISIRYPDFFDVTEVMINNCRDLARMAIVKNIYVIEKTK